MGVRSASRLDADRNYAEVVIPALAKILPEHSGYLALRAGDIEGIFDEALSEANRKRAARSEEHTSELQSLMRISYAVFCLTKKIYNHNQFYNLHLFLSMCKHTYQT